MASSGRTLVDLFFRMYSFMPLELGRDFQERFLCLTPHPCWLQSENLLTVEMILSIQYLPSHSSWLTWLSNYFSCSVVQIADR